MRRTCSFSVLFVLTTLCVSMVGCGNADAARQKIREVHLDEVKTIINEDVTRHRIGIRAAAERFARGFVVEDPEQRERGIRTGLRYIQEPPRGIPELTASPMSFLAAIDSDGRVIARDVAEAADDRMRGQDFGERFACVRTALTDGVPVYELVEFPGADGEPSSFSMMFVHPVRHEGSVVGVMAAGIPLWRMAQRLSRQLQGDYAAEAGLLLWVYAYKGDDLHHFGTPELLTPLIPQGAARQEGLSGSAGGYTGELDLSGRKYGYGVVPFPRIGEDVGFILVRSDPT